MRLRHGALRLRKEKPVTVRFRGFAVGVFPTDLLVNDAVVVELGCARTIDPSHEAQLLNYLKATQFEVGLLVNFGTRPQFRRLLLDNDRKQSPAREHAFTARVSTDIQKT